MQIITLEALLMDNGEILCLGETIGWERQLGKAIKSRAEID